MSLRQEVKRNLLGCLEAALFMPIAAKRFGGGYDEMLRSFFIPVLLFPLVLLAVFAYPPSAMEDVPQTTLSLVYVLRFYITLGAFLALVYFIALKIERREHFFQFITAYNWLAVPSTLLCIPFLWMLGSEFHTLQEAQAVGICLVVYSCAYTAFMAAYVLRIPIELAGFIIIMGFMIDQSSYKVIDWFGSIL